MLPAKYDLRKSEKNPIEKVNIEKFSFKFEEVICLLLLDAVAVVEIFSFMDHRCSEICLYQQLFHAEIGIC